MKNWRTTTIGIIAIATAVMGFIKATIDGDPTTEPDFAALTAALTAGIGLIFAKDAKTIEPPQKADP
jgi:hypothetical protein